MEVCIFICLLAWQLYDLPSSFEMKQDFDLEEAQDRAYEALATLLGSIMAAYDHRMEEQIDETTLATMMSDFRMDQGG